MILFESKHFYFFVLFIILMKGYKDGCRASTPPHAELKTLYCTLADNDTKAGARHVMSFGTLAYCKDSLVVCGIVQGCLNELIANGQGWACGQARCSAQPDSQAVVADNCCSAKATQGTQELLGLTLLRG